MLKCSCLCQKVQFEAEEMPGIIYNCHCSRCRKSSGAAFVTQVFAKRDTLRILAGKENIKEYESTGGIRTFCSECGSRLMNYGKEGVNYLSVAVSAIDNSVDTKPLGGECFTADKLAWVKVLDDVPAYPGFPQGEGG